MVDLELDATTTSTAAKTSPESKFCRLCLEENDLIVNLFEEQLEADATRNTNALSEKLFDLFQIKYEQTPSLPNSICKECLQMIESFSIFRENVHKIESELQKRVATLKYGGLANGMGKVMEEPLRAGLNGHPGEFIPEEAAVIIEVNPDEDYESSDDEFSMDSDSDAEEEPGIAKKPKTTSASNIQADSLITTAQSTTSMDIEIPSVVDSVVKSKVNETSLLTSSNIVEKTYTVEGAPTKITYSCQYCDMAFSQQNECVEHVARHDPAGPYVCSFCTSRFINRQHLIAHIRELHDNDRPYVCAICNKGFMRRSDLRKHSIVHTGIRPYTCNVCTKSFSRNTNLTKHMRTHTGARSHICSRCPRSFGSAPELARHTRTHIINKPFHCSRCSASFTRRDQLMQHEQTHLRRDGEFLKNQSSNLGNTNTNATAPISTDAIHQQQQQQQQQQHQQESIVMPLNPYVGSIDQNTFNTGLSAPPLPLTPLSGEDPYRHSILAAQLQQPRAPPLQKPAPPPTMIAHPPKQSHHSRHFACEICSQTFTRERDYQRHQALHLDTLFTCKQCGMGFSRREKLVRHELEQHAPQYPCNICRIPFTKLSDFELHMKMHELQQSVTMTAQAASLLSAGGGLHGFGINPQQQQQQQLHPHQMQQQQSTSMLPPPSKEFLGRHQRPSAADMTFYSQMVPTMNLGFYSETRPEDRNGI